MTTSRALFQLGSEISPIILTNGIAKYIPGGMLPIVAITEASSFTIGLLSGSINLDLDTYLCHFMPLPGSMLINNDIGEYPFANQAVAANAIIAKPIPVSLLMNCPVNQGYGYISKFTTISALKSALDLHNSMGGTYIVATPSYIYKNCILKQMRDVTGSGSKQVQQQWQFDFEKPLLTESEAGSVLNALMSKLSGGLPVDTPSWSGAAVSSGTNFAGTTNITSAKNLTGTASGLG